MPKIEVPLRDVTEIRKLKTNKSFMSDAERLVELSERKRKIEEELEDLRPRLYPVLSAALDPDERSVRFEDYRITAYQGSPAKRLDKKKLLKYIPAAKLERCYTEGAEPKPTISVTHIPTETEKETVRRMKGKLLHGDDEE